MRCPVAMLPLCVLLAAAPARPIRLVSINPCLDAILHDVADPAEIVAISHYSRDPRATSVPLAWARRFPVTSGTAEEVVALRPDLVLTGPHVAPATLAALARLHIRVEAFPVPDTVAESMAQVRRVGVIAGHADRGVALARAIEAAARPATGPAVAALVWEGGLVPGAGTLPDELLRRAGFRDMSAAYGLKKWDVLPLEYLVARPPRVLFSVAVGDGGDERLARHPAVRRLATHIRVIGYPSRLMNCGGPTIIEAMARLRAARASAGTGA